MEGELLLVLAGALALYLLARPSRRGPKPGDNVFLFGDSLAQGLATPLGKAMAARGIRMTSDVQPGTRLDQWVSRGPAGAISAAAKYALISLGTNDALANEGHRQQEQILAQDISSRLRLAGVTPIWLLPPPMRFQTFPEEQAIMATGDRVLHTMDYPRYDGLHPTPAGFQAWASDIVSRIT